jgi:hypothetical protein
MYAALDEAASGESVYFRMDRLRKMRDENVYLLTGIYSAKMVDLLYNSVNVASQNSANSTFVLRLAACHAAVL